MNEITSLGKSCESCMFFRNKEERMDGLGECHRHAPAVPPPPTPGPCGGTTYYTHRFWPIVEPEEWCGEHVFANADLAREWMVKKSKLCDDANAAVIEAAQKRAFFRRSPPMPDRIRKEHDSGLSIDIQPAAVGELGMMTIFFAPGVQAELEYIHAGNGGKLTCDAQYFWGVDSGPPWEPGGSLIWWQDSPLCGYQFHA